MDRQTEYWMILCVNLTKARDFREDGALAEKMHP